MCDCLVSEDWSCTTIIFILERKKRRNHIQQLTVNYEILQERKNTSAVVVRKPSVLYETGSLSTTVTLRAEILVLAYVWCVYRLFIVLAGGG